MSADVRRLTIELSTGEPIQGRLIDDAGATHAFHGWLELSTVIERAREQNVEHTTTSIRPVRSEET
jgi:hypothetical protein